MRISLFLLVLLAAGAAGYEYFQHTQEAADYVQQRARFDSDLADLKAKNKNQMDENNALTAKLASLQAQAAQLKEEASTPAESTPGTNAPSSAPTPAANPSLAPPADR